ncbi:FGGY-family carbohydrate kinase [Acidisphaera sp. L21]|uniref:FGGY-family carbohydrate kinase n=1 Tax=Acidisphaera sp. L21 TaxID=1641851 RepID=UPI00131D0C88|nr:FGGY-family carbohydrate kinase [Acidisphaera sp. L21]
MDVVIGVDVGTGSARAGVFDPAGTMLAQSSRPIRTWRPAMNFVQQSSGDIWAAVCASVREAMAAAGPHTVRGIGFDATCSLVVLDAAGRPVSVDPDGAAEQDIIVWMDHRAASQADRINATGHDVLRYVGGRISLEMETPKLLWLKEEMPETWARAAHFFDLPDYLTWRATGALSRSLCSTVCKWTYLGHEARWDESFFRAIGLGALADEGFARIGQTVLPMGAQVGAGLSAAAADELGLAPGIPVGASAIDAHAGGLGVIGATLDGPTDLRRRVALIGGTSSCHMAVSPEPNFVPGVWGPYFSAMVPGMWLNEGGQSATGALIDHLVQTHAVYPAVAQQAQQTGQHVFALLADRLDTLAAGQDTARLTAGLHVMPDFHGNRSPRADATLRGMVSGLSLSATVDDLALLYLAAVQAVAYGTRHIIETMNANGAAIDTILACGGGTKDRVFLRQHADATGCRVVLPREPEAVLLGAAMLGAVAGGVHADIQGAMAAMSAAGTVIEPAVATRAYHDAKYAVFQRMHQDQLSYRAVMAVTAAQ